ncbi:hypothetical protein GQ457_11G027600 [Hibiscus cannabinus]
MMYNAQEISKLDPKSRKCKFLGYTDGVKGYRLWDPTARKVIISRDVIFVEDKLQREEEKDGTVKENAEATQIEVEKEFEQRDSFEAEPEHEEPEPENWHSDYVIEGNVAYYLLTEDGEPSTFQEAMNNSDASQWMTAMQEEIEALHKNNTWDLVPLPQGRKPIDDMLVAGPKKDHIEELKARLAREFEMKDLGPTQDCKTISTPLPINFKLSSSMSPSSEEERMEMSRVPYASAMGSLMFAMICTRPDIAQAVGVVSRYMANPGKEHWNAVKRILRYIKGSLNVALCYGGSDFLISGYVDSDYAPDLDKSKSTTGYVFTIAGGAVSWVSKLQSVVATSITEAEYVAATQASKEAIWLKMLVEELGHKQEYVSLFCESQSALHLARNHAFHSRTKHIRVPYHFIREKVEEGIVDIQKIHTNDNIADFMTKAINTDKFVWCRSSCDLLET